MEVDWSFATSALEYAFKTPAGRVYTKESLTPDQIMAAFKEAESWDTMCEAPCWKAAMESLNLFRVKASLELHKVEGNRVLWLQGFLSAMEAFEAMPTVARAAARRVRKAVEV